MGEDGEDGGKHRKGRERAGELGAEERRRLGQAEDERGRDEHPHWDVPARADEDEALAGRVARQHDQRYRERAERGGEERCERQARQRDQCGDRGKAGGAGAERQRPGVALCGEGISERE